MPRINWSPPTVSDATKARFVSRDSMLPYDHTYRFTGDTDIAILYPQLVQYDDFVNLDNWNLTTTGGSITLADGVVTMNGDGTFGNTKMVNKSQVVVTPNFYELKVFGYPTYLNVGLNQLAGMANQATGFDVQYRSDFGLGYVQATGTYFWLAVMGYQSPQFYGPAANIEEWFTFRFYFLKSHINGALGARMMLTFQSDTTYPIETVSTIINAAMGSDSYPNYSGGGFYATMFRQTNNATYPFKFKLYRCYSGYVSDGSVYRQQLGDAGSFGYFHNFDLSVLAPIYSDESSTNEYQYLFADNTDEGSWSGSWLTLAQLNALGKQLGDHRYVGIRTQLNSTGSVQAFAGPLNHTSAIDYATTSGMITLAEETTRNTITPAHVELDYDYYSKGVLTSGILESNRPSWARIIS